MAFIVGAALAFTSSASAETKGASANPIWSNAKARGTSVQRPVAGNNDGGIAGPVSDCCTAHPTPGCDDAACQALICGFDAFCCDVEWDGICAGNAGIFCAVCGGTKPLCGDGACTAPVENQVNCPADCGFCGDGICQIEFNEPANCPEDCAGVSTCCSPQPGPGCDDPNCQALVCSADAFCCDVAWDGLCVAAAQTVCKACGGTKPVCGDGLCQAPFENLANCPADCTPPACAEAVCPPGGILEGEICDDGAAPDTVNGGCNSVPPVYSSIACGETVCGTFWFNGALRDTDWYQFTLTEAAQVTWTVNSSAGHVAFIINNICPATVIAVGTPVGTCGQQATITLAAGTYVAFAATDFAAQVPCGSESSNYTGVLECAPIPPCEPTPGGPKNDCCEDRILIGDGDHLFSTIGAATDGFPNAGCQFDGQTYNDIWYNYTADCSGVLTVSTCNQVDYDSDLAVYAGNDCDNLELVACNDDGVGCAGFSSIVSFPVCAGSTYKIRVGGWQATDAGSGTLTVSNSGAGCPEPCSSDLNGDGVTNVVDLLQLIGNWGVCD
jgi:hypothetical protein